MRMKTPTTTRERKLFSQGFKHVIGVDEVGMGCLAGPVVVCAVAISEQFYRTAGRTLPKIRDSKLLSEKQRDSLIDTLVRMPGLAYRVTLCRPTTVDRLNIYQAARRAMQQSIRKLNTPDPFVLVDGNKPIAGLSVSQKAIVKGDRDVWVIACASIIAKVFRDRMMVRYAKRYPGYGFEIHKGYGTPVHLARLAELGPCELHRKSFAPVAKFL